MLSLISSQNYITILDPGSISKILPFTTVQQLPDKFSNPPKTIHKYRTIFCKTKRFSHFVLLLNGYQAGPIETWRSGFSSDRIHLGLSIQPNIIKEHRTFTAGLRIVPVA